MVSRFSQTHPSDPVQPTHIYVYVSAFLAALLAAWSVAAAARPDDEVLRRMESSVVRLHAVFANGAVSKGSAVRIDRTRYATACHVLRDAQAAFLLVGRNYIGTTLARADYEFDLCVLEALAETDAVVATPRGEPALVGDTVYSVGYPHGQGLVISSGRVYGRHGDTAREVIQTSAAFEEGASGGGLFDGEGRLLGILSFLVPYKGPNYFVLPIGAIDSLPAPVPTGATALWMLPISEQPRFLQALSYGAQRDWESLRQRARLGPPRTRSMRPH